MSVPSEISTRLADALTWEWQPVQEVIDKLAPLIPPGQALRAFEGRSTARAGIRPMTEDDKIRSGRRGILRTSIGSLVAGNRAELQGEARGGGQQYIRRVERRSIPEHAQTCPTCRQPLGAPVVQSVALDAPQQIVEVEVVGEPFREEYSYSRAAEHLEEASKHRASSAVYGGATAVAYAYGEEAVDVGTAGARAGGQDEGWVAEFQRWREEQDAIMDAFQERAMRSIEVESDRAHQGVAVLRTAVQKVRARVKNLEFELGVSNED